LSLFYFLYFIAYLKHTLFFAFVRTKHEITRTTGSATRSCQNNE
jgi:hypothetical protein